MSAISLIVPVYNGAKYLRDMAQSVLAQDFADFQLIFSDDGSTDGTAAILAELAAQDGRVCVVTGENRGVSAARNRALDVAGGDYIGFADADDLLEPGYLRMLVGALEDTGADMVCCGFTRIYEKSGRTDRMPTGFSTWETVDRNGMMERLLRPDGYTTVMWNKLLRRQALTGPDDKLLRFDETLHIVEDGEYLFRSGVQTAVFFPESLYRYTVRDSGAMYSGAVTERKLTELKARKQIVMLTENAAPQVRALAKMKYQKGVRDLMFHAVIGGDGRAVRHLRPELRVYAKELFACPALSKKEKLKYHVYRPLIQLNLRRVGAFLMDKLSGH